VRHPRGERASQAASGMGCARGAASGDAEQPPSRGGGPSLPRALRRRSGCFVAVSVAVSLLSFARFLQLVFFCCN
ncbi:unnamed protein product, partial [Polarella glacialis]